METISALKQLEGNLAITGDRVSSLSAKLEDLLFRAQRIATNMKNNFKSTDNMFGYDLQNFRREIRTFSHEIGALPTVLGGIERASAYDENAIRFAQNVMRMADRVSKSVALLYNNALLAHSHIRAADHKIEAWYLVQEIEQMLDKAKTLPNTANKIVIRVSTPGTAP